MTDIVDIRLDGIPADQLVRAILCVRGYARTYPDRRGVRNGAIYKQVSWLNGPDLFVYRTNGGRLVCRLLKEERQ